MQVSILTPEIDLASKSVDELRKMLFLEKHPQYPTHYLVEALDKSFAYDFEDLIGNYRAIFQFEVDKLRDRAEDLGYEQLIYLDDPTEVIERQEKLNEPYPYPLEAELMPFQLRGFNYCKELESDIINWSTGTGKSVYAVAKAKYLLESGQVERVVVVSKGHNKINWQRQFEKIAGLNAAIGEAKGSNANIRRERRAEIYASEPIFIINYEKLRFLKKNMMGDGDELLAALKKKNVYFIWDEMPTRLKNTSTGAWKGAKQIIGATKTAYQSMLSATPLENSPEDIYSCVKLLDPTVFGTLTKFRQEYAKTMNPWNKWKVDTWNMAKLQEMGMRLAHMTHSANKYLDPEIAAQFPEEHWEDIYIDLSDEDAALYSSVQDALREEYKIDPQMNILSRLLILQLICNNPALLNKSDSEIAQKIVAKKMPTDKNSAKLQTLRDLLDQIDGKVVLFSMYNDFGAKPLSQYIAEWGHSFVLYDGNDKKKQDAQDRFQTDPKIKLFITSDQGSDSINLEQATSVINYDMPWNYSVLLQRVNRINRITSTATNVWYYNLVCAYTMEERKKEILEKKKAYQEAISDPTAKVMEAVMGMTASDYKYILFGED